MQELLIWMEQHEKLAGWAQTVGAVIALAIALAVPWFQHIYAARRTKIADLEKELILSMSTRLVLVDVLLSLERAIQLADLPKIELRDDRMIGEILERLRNLDARDVNLARQASQYSARWIILRLYSYIDSGKAKGRDITPDVVKFFHRDHTIIKEEVSKIDWMINKFVYEHTLLQVGLLRRPLIWFGFKTSAGRKWLATETEKQTEKIRAQIDRGY